jgi:tripartite-type tricarboxylate transporter receptor subunit TctC
VLNGAVYSLNYDLLNDFAPISPLTTAPNLLYAKKTVPARDLAELIAWLKSNPKVSAGTTGQRLVVAVFQRETGTRLAVVPYRGNNAVFQDGRAAAGAGRQPQSLCCDKQHASDRGTGYSDLCRTGISPGFLFAMGGLFAPKGTPKDVIAKLNAAAVAALADPTVQSRLVELGQEIFPRERQSRCREMVADHQGTWDQSAIIRGVRSGSTSTDR